MPQPGSASTNNATFAQVAALDAKVTAMATSTAASLQVITAQGTAAAGQLNAQNQALASLQASQATQTGQLDAIAAAIAALAAGGGVTPPPPDGGAWPAFDPNHYPLSMVPVTNPGDPVTIGTGPRSLVLLLGNYPQPLGQPESQCCNVNVAIGTDELAMTTVAQNLLVTANSGMDPNLSQRFVVNGSWPSGNMHIRISGSGYDQGAAGLWLNGAIISTNPAYYDTSHGSLDARGAIPPVNSTAVWDNTGAPAWMTTVLVPVTAPPPPPPVVDPTIVSGAKLNGAPLPPSTLAAMDAVCFTGDVLSLPSGRIFGTAGQTKAYIVEGSSAAGSAPTIIDAAGIRTYNQKGILVPAVAGSGPIIRHLELCNAANSDGNCAGIRNDATGMGFTGEDLFIHDCQDGLLTFGGCGITLRRTKMRGNGNGNPGTGATHNVYFGGVMEDANEFVLIEDPDWEVGTLGTHCLKSRSGKTTVQASPGKRGRLVGNSDDGTNGGAVIDLPNGGEVHISDCDIIMGATAGNHGLLQYGTDFNSYPARNPGVTLTRVQFQQSAPGWLRGQAWARLTLIDVTYTGGTPPDLAGWGSVVGTMTPA